MFPACLKNCFYYEKFRKAKVYEVFRNVKHDYEKLRIKGQVAWITG